jgi:hypothetical protein
VVEPALGTLDGACAAGLHSGAVRLVSLPALACAVVTSALGLGRPASPGNDASLLKPSRALSVGGAWPARLGAGAAVLLGLIVKRLQFMGFRRKFGPVSAGRATVTPQASQTFLKASLLNLMLLRPHAGFWAKAQP